MLTESQRQVSASIAALEETEGWKYLVLAAEKLIQIYTPNITSFTSEEATEIASKMAFISGVKRCLGIPEQHKKKLLTGQEPII